MVRGRFGSRFENCSGSYPIRSIFLKFFQFRFCPRIPDPTTASEPTYAFARDA